MRRTLLAPLPLVRDHIGISLRDYFARDVIITQSATRRTSMASLPFKEMAGEGDYRRAVAALYATKPRAWLTPVEVFAPLYSEAVARWIAASHARRGRDGAAAKRSLHVVEAGGGAGTNAAAILSWFKVNEPEVYRTMRYTLLDVSEAQAQRQEAATKAHGAKRRVIVCPDGKWAKALKESAESAESNTPFGRPSSPPPRRKRGRGATSTNFDVHIVALELLDNLPHDKVLAKAAQDNGLPADLFEVLVVPESDAGELGEGGTVSSGGLREVLRPLRDPLLKRALTYCPGLAPPLLRSAELQDVPRESIGA